MKRFLPPLYIGEWGDEDTFLRIGGLEEALDTDLDNFDAIRQLSSRLFHDYKHGHVGMEMPPGDEDLTHLQSDLELVHLCASIGVLQAAAGDAGDRIAELICIGQFYGYMWEIVADGSPPITCVGIDRVWPAGQDEDSPHASASVMAGDLMVTLAAIEQSKGSLSCKWRRKGEAVIAAA
ncbi:MAG: hypothetical protein ACYC63_21050 [Armatimonadota bacterium]